MARGTTRRSSTRDIAAEIDRLLTVGDDLPSVGGEYDTKIGWARRLGIKDHKRLTRVIDLLMQTGDAKKVVGHDWRNNAPYTCDLIWSRVLAGRAKAR